MEPASGATSTTAMPLPPESEQIPIDNSFGNVENTDLCPPSAEAGPSQENMDKETVKESEPEVAMKRRFDPDDEDLRKKVLIKQYEMAKLKYEIFEARKSRSELRRKLQEPGSPPPLPSKKQMNRHVEAVGCQKVSEPIKAGASKKEAKKHVEAVGCQKVSEPIEAETSKEEANKLVEAVGCQKVSKPIPIPKPKKMQPSKFNYHWY